ncbi:D-alanine-D-alanine ligase [Thermonema lapsum]|uniref:D-alanine--D-alanine ligase n=1 Tax=Thermonema lapsum TaxID=28195 RepID=A0A846MPI0_9BACT|nr:D-alanine--D-alanine ligase [Thermonema lapsum]NIK73365.1 D-alanine-D-alanine ligase [Thermonema lapsum]
MIRIGIFLGGNSREREVAFAGGRTVYDNLDKSLFEAIPIFVDSLGRFILLEWEYLYKGTIRDFYPPAQYQPKDFQIYIESLGHMPRATIEQIAAEVGRPISPADFSELFDVAFLTLHGSYGEDGTIQGLLEWHGIPYTGSGILPSAIGIDKATQQRLFQKMGFERPAYQLLHRSDYLRMDSTALQQLLHDCLHTLGNRLVIKSAHQGSSIGVSVLRNPSLDDWKKALDKAFFIRRLALEHWHRLNAEQQRTQIIEWIDIREGLGFPMLVEYQDEQTTLYHPHQLREWLDRHTSGEVTLYALQNTETEVLIEAFIEGQEFSCIVIEDLNGKPIALPPTQIIKQNEVFDYRAKYLPGISRKITPIELPEAQIEAIREACVSLYEAMEGEVYARIDGFITPQGKIYLNDPNTTSGMMPSSFFFHQAAEIGFDPSRFLTYIIERSLQVRASQPNLHFKSLQLLERLHALKDKLHKQKQDTIRVGVIMGGYSSERHISVESGRNVYEKLSASTKYSPIPLFLTGNAKHWQLYRLPIHLMLKDNADDIKEKIEQYKKHPIIEKIKQEAQGLTAHYAPDAFFEPQAVHFEELPEMVDVVFIALHGRPGEDGSLQAELEKYSIPYNGSGVASSQITINKYETNEILKKHGIAVAEHRLVHKKEWEQEGQKLIEAIEATFAYPFIAKPTDDGCSSAVKKVKNREELLAYIEASFRAEETLDPMLMQRLGLKPGAPFPPRDSFLIEELITARGARRFLEITGGLLTHIDAEGNRQYEVFSPSETPALGEVLSLEEKFLAGEGQNITPARFSEDPEENRRITEIVKQQLQKVAEILDVEGYARIDAFVRVYSPEEVETIIVEVNSLPGMTPATCIFHQAALHHYTPYDFIDKILSYALKKSKNTKLKHA